MLHSKHVNKILKLNCVVGIFSKILQILQNKIYLQMSKNSYIKIPAIISYLDSILLHFKTLLLGWYHGASLPKIRRGKLDIWKHSQLCAQLSS